MKSFVMPAGSPLVFMRTLTLAEAAEFGIVRVIVNNTDKAEAALKEAGYVSAITQVVAVVVPDKPGGLYRVLKMLSDQNINIDYTYAFTGKQGEGAYNILHMAPKDTQPAIEIMNVWFSGSFVKSISFHKN